MLTGEGESQTCGRLACAGLELCLPTPSSAQVAGWPGGPARAGQRSRGHRAEGLPPGARLGPGLPHLGAPPAPPDRCAPQAASREMKGVCRTEPDFMDFVHFSTPAVASIV